MEDDNNAIYKYCNDINGRRIRMTKNNHLEIWCWRDWVKKPYWFKHTMTKMLTKEGYAHYKVKFNKKTLSLSRIVYKMYNQDWDITDNGDNNFVDHINQNSCDNRIENLRILTRQQNGFNTKAKGYSWIKKNKRWRVRIQIDGKEIQGGCYKEEQEAKEAYLKLKQIYHKI